MRTDRRPAGAAIVLLALAAGSLRCTRDLTDVVPDGTEAVRSALAASADPNRIGVAGDAPIHLATLRRECETVRILLEHGAQVDLLNARHATALGIAVDTGCAPCVYQLLLARADPNALVDAADPRSDRMLHRAARAGAPELVAMLIGAGADPNVRSGSGDTPLHFAAAADAYRAPVVARLLVEHGGDLRATNAIGETPVHAAALYDSLELLAYYASVGADLDAANGWGASPLDRALERHQVRAADLLYRLGARPLITPEFEPPLIAASRLDDIGQARWLLTFGADPRQTFHGRSAAEVARESGSAEVSALLSGALGGR